MQTIARLYALSKRNIILRYKNSFAGFLWGFLKPLLYLLIFIVIFSSQFSSVSNYVLYATSGLIFWFFFSNVTSQSVQNIVASAGLIKSINLPVVLFPLSEMLSEMFNFLLTLLVFFIVMYWFGIDYGPHLLLIIPCVILFSAFCLGITLALSSVNVFLRDAGILWQTIQPAIFYMTPIAYPEDMIPERFSFIIRFNPVYSFIRLGRSIFYDGGLPSGSLWLTCLCLSSASLLLGLFVFNRLKNQFISAI
jgi:ABC-2 type transport system permease protein